MSPDPQKFENITNFAASSSVTEVRSLPGMTNYCSRFTKNYGTITEPLGEFTHKNQPWQWTSEHDHALTQLKQALPNAPVTAYFNPEFDTELTVDTSPTGLGDILAQINPASGYKHNVDP